MCALAAPGVYSLGAVGRIRRNRLGISPAGPWVVGRPLNATQGAPPRPLRLQSRAKGAEDNTQIHRVHDGFPQTMNVKSET